MVFRAIKQLPRRPLRDGFSSSPGIPSYSRRTVLLKYQKLRCTRINHIFSSSTCGKILHISAERARPLTAPHIIVLQHTYYASMCY
ncbi:hypothetical protein PILCRDRAFT_825842 [Piloderma croceum F 1598]|uniref:Uncharacterized protein n=1 Tax=Piloderma croceum (strain F 1598) TaxID=765440 RepID=A0A0C3ASF6_PILCF|nr:hypothetical protein PILCRDRAFT_825842 [Piloderma croceum F 1598]